MALLIRGKTRCGICGNVIGDADEATMFGTFVPNVFDPLLLFNDAPLHTSCFRAHPLAGEATRRWDEQQERASFGRRMCDACNEEILRPDDWLFVSHLTSDSSDPLYRFNYRHLHRSHVTSWPEREVLESLLRPRVEAGEFKGPSYDALLRELRN